MIAGCVHLAVRKIVGVMFLTTLERPAFKPLQDQNSDPKAQKICFASGQAINLMPNFLALKSIVLTSEQALECVKRTLGRWA